VYDSITNIVITSAKKHMSLSLFVRLFLATFCENFKRIYMKFLVKVGNGPMKKRLNFGGDLNHRLDTGIVFRIRHYWEIRKVVLLLHPVIHSY